MSDTEKLVDEVARALYPAIVWGTDYDEVPYDDAMRRPRHISLAKLVRETSERVIAIVDDQRP